jgi:hypothetical protein
MKFTLVVRQAAVVEAGLVGKITVTDLCFLDYLRGWFFCEGAEIRVVGGQKFVWLRYERAIEELPLLFSPQAQIASRKNQLSNLIQKLREAELVETKKVGRRLFFRFTDLAVRLTQRSERPAPTSTKPATTVTPPHDETVTPAQDGTATSFRDEYLPAIIDETGIKESGRKETPPLSPYEGEAESILALWNSFPELLPAQTITRNRARKIRKRMADPFWREHWREGVQRAAASPPLTGKGSNGWRATLDWFLGGDSLAKILEGQYDNRPQQDHKSHVSDVKAQIKAVDELIGDHPANEDCTSYNEDATSEQREDLRKLHRRRAELVRQLAGVPRTTRLADDFDDWWKCPVDELLGYIHGAALSGQNQMATRVREIYETRKNEPKRW